MEKQPLPDGLTLRPATINDAPGVTAVIAACERSDGNPPTITVDELLLDWDGLDLANDSIVVVNRDGKIVASADILNRRYVQVAVYGYVHPDQRGHGIGTALVHWGEAWATTHMQHAPANARVLTEHFVGSTNTAARQLLEGLGYTLVRTHYAMGIDLQAPPPATVWPDGLAIRAFVSGQDDQAVFATGEETFEDSWGRPPSTKERWLQPTRSPDFDPSLWFLVEDRQAGEAVGVCLCQIVAGRGHVDTVGVRRPWRRQGVALAMLHHAFGEFFRRGVREVELNVDAESATGAPRVYSRAGMHVTRSYSRYQKILRPGVPLVAEA